MSIITSININAFFFYLKIINIFSLFFKKTQPNKNLKKAISVSYLGYFVESGGVRE